MEQFLKKIGWTSIVTSLVFTVLGFIIVYNPNETFQFISYLLGGTLIIFGIIKIIEYIKTKDSYDLYNDELVYGIMAILLGIVVIVCNGMIETVLRVLIGLWIIYSGAMRFALALKIQKLNVDNKIWISVLLISLVILFCGIYIVANPGAVMVTIGIVMIVYGIMDIAEEIIFMRNVKNML